MKLTRLAPALPFAVLFGSLVALPRSASETGLITAGDGSSTFGWSVDADQSRLAVGRPFSLPGTALVYVRQATGWVQEALFEAGAGPISNRYGFDVALDGDTLVVGAPRVGAGGRAYVYRRVNGTWSLEADFVASGVGGQDQFGHSVGLDGDTAVVGAYRDSSVVPDGGAAYVFERTGTSWAETAELEVGVPTAFEKFGRDVAIDGDRIVVGADDATGNEAFTGAAYVFERLGAGWVQTAKLIAPDGVVGDELGKSVAIEGDRIVAGAPSHSVPSGHEHGSAYVFGRRAGGWVQEAKLHFANTLPQVYVGTSVAIDGADIAVGAEGISANGRLAGAAAHFARCGSTYSEEQLDPSDPSWFDRFGHTVDVEDHTVFVGAPYYDEPQEINSGAVYFYDRPSAFTSVCVGAANSAGDGATIAATGCPVVSANDFTLSVKGLPVPQPGVFFFGPTATQAPFGDGFLCVAPPVERLNPPLSADSNGTVERAVDLTVAPGAGVVMPGVTSLFQFWYRDPAAGASGFNLTDALQVDWE